MNVDVSTFDISKFRILPNVSIGTREKSLLPMYQTANGDVLQFSWDGLDDVSELTDVLCWGDLVVPLVFEQGLHPIFDVDTFSVTYDDVHNIISLNLVFKTQPDDGSSKSSKTKDKTENESSSESCNCCATFHPSGPLKNYTGLFRYVNVIGNGGGLLIVPFLFGTPQDLISSSSESSTDGDGSDEGSDESSTSDEEGSSTEFYTGDVITVKSIEYSLGTHELKYAYQILTFENGLLLKVVDGEADKLIDQAVQETICC